MGHDKETINDLIYKDPEMVDSFVAEAKEHLDTIEEDFLKLEKQKENPDKTLVDKVFRAIHSVKGASGFLLVDSMTSLSHVMETLLARMREGEILPESEYIDALLAGVDLLVTMLDDIKSSNKVDITSVRDRLLYLLEKGPTTKSGGVKEGKGKKTKKVGEEKANIAVEHSGETQSSKSVPPIQEQPGESTADNETEVSAQDKSGIDLDSTIRINLDLLDKLMILAGELVLVRNQFRLSADESDPILRSISQRLDMVTSDMQETIIRTRMQPISKIFGKLPRIVRELGKKLGKQIEVDITGSESELDRSILESLTDPMNHIFRNCCGHGIETPEERAKAGKPKCGRIGVAAYHEAGRFNIEIRDDGKGIDHELVRKKALEKGLKTGPELDQMSEKESLQLIFLPGFSTQDKTDNVSGRGVGLDVVKTGIERLGGSFDIETTVGKGTKMHLRLPLTLAIIPSLIVTLGGNVYAIPQASLVELVCLYDEDVRTKIECADDQEVYRLRDRLLPMVRFSEVLERPTRFTREVRAEITEKYRKKQEKARQDFINAGGSEDNVRFSQSLNFAVLKACAGRFGLIVDQILGTEEIVVKPLHWAVKSLGIYSGVTIMGNGKGALILDVEGIARHAGITLEGLMDKASDTDKVRDEDLQTVLLFKSGEKEQFAVALPLIGRVETISISDIEQIGEGEYIRVDGKSIRILRLDHVLSVSPVVERKEMYLILPRHIRHPVGILASSLIDIEETSAELDVKTYMEEGLLGTGIVRDCMTLFIDIFRLIEIIEPKWFIKSWRRQSTKVSNQPESSKQVLFLDDDLSFRHLVKGYLEEDGYKVTTAENGQIGLDQMSETQFDLVVSDLNMPVMDGWRFIESVRQGEQQSDIPAVALTHLDTDGDREMAKKCGFDRYEVKFDREHFLETVAELLGLGRSSPREAANNP